MRWKIFLHIFLFFPSKRIKLPVSPESLILHAFFPSGLNNFLQKGKKKTKKQKKNKSLHYSSRWCKRKDDLLFVIFNNEQKHHKLIKKLKTKRKNKIEKEIKNSGYAWLLARHPQRANPGNGVVSTCGIQGARHTPFHPSSSSFLLRSYPQIPLSFFFYFFFSFSPSASAMERETETDRSQM